MNISHCANFILSPYFRAKDPKRFHMVPIKRALISVSDKTGIVDFARDLQKFSVEIVSTGGTAKLLGENGVRVTEISAFTGFPEMLGGRVKTLHPAVHAGLLALRSDTEHLRVLREYQIGLIDMVVVNLYPFEKTVINPHVRLEEAIENIDIGGPSMLRSAAKNHASVAVICNPARYREVIVELTARGGELPEELLKELAVEAFGATSRYDTAIHEFLAHRYAGNPGNEIFPARLDMGFEKIQDLRYGENPHQRGAFYRERGKHAGLAQLKQLHGKELSFNNILDLNAAYETVKEFGGPAAVIVKHSNACGVAQAASLHAAYTAAWKCDTLSAFGGIVAVNRRVDEQTAAVIARSGFRECVIAPEFSSRAVAILGQKKNLRLVESRHLEPVAELDFKRVCGGLLVQEKDLQPLNLDAMTVVTRKKPTKLQMESLLFAWKTVKHLKSNAIVLSRGTKTVGIGAGQMSRVDSVRIAVGKAGKNAHSSCLASDAFFPKPDSIVCAARAGVGAIIQPGGSIADEEIIRACDKHKIGMVFTGIRHFKH